MMEYVTGLQYNVRLQLEHRLLGRIFKTETGHYEPEPPFLELILNSLLSRAEPMTVAQIAEMMGIDRTEVYHLLSSLQARKLVAAVLGKPIKFIAIKKSQQHKTAFREMYDYE